MCTLKMGRVQILNIFAPMLWRIKSKDLFSVITFKKACSMLLQFWRGRETRTEGMQVCAQIIPPFSLPFKWLPRPLPIPEQLNIMHSSIKMGVKSVFFRSPVVFNSPENLEGEGILRAKMCKGKTVSLAGIFKGVWYSNQLKFLEQVWLFLSLVPFSTGLNFLHYLHFDWLYPFCKMIYLSISLITVVNNCLLPLLDMCG